MPDDGAGIGIGRILEAACQVDSVLRDRHAGHADGPGDGREAEVILCIDFRVCGHTVIIGRACHRARIQVARRALEGSADDRIGTGSEKIVRAAYYPERILIIGGVRPGQADASGLGRRGQGSRTGHRRGAPGLGDEDLLRLYGKVIHDEAAAEVIGRQGCCGYRQVLDLVEAAAHYGLGGDEDVPVQVGAPLPGIAVEDDPQDMPDILGHCGCPELDCIRIHEVARHGAGRPLHEPEQEGRPRCGHRAVSQADAEGPSGLDIEGYLGLALGRSGYRGEGRDGIVLAGPVDEPERWRPCPARRIIHDFKLGTSPVGHPGPRRARRHVAAQVARGPQGIAGEVFREGRQPIRLGDGHGGGFAHVARRIIGFGLEIMGTGRVGGRIPVGLVGR